MLIEPDSFVCVVLINALFAKVVNEHKASENEETELSSEGEELTLGKLAMAKNVSVIPEEDDLIHKVVRSEVNFLVLPFFALWDKDVKKRTKTEYKAVIKRGGQRLEISWVVSSNPEFGYPGPFDKTVHRAIEQIIGELPFPIKNPISIGSFYNLCRRMGIKKGGKTYKSIKAALIRLRTTTVHSKGAFYSKGKEKYIEEVFGICDRVIFTGERLEDGEISDTNYLYLNSWYLENINANYVKPLDWNYYNALETPIAQRLYELLSVKFYGVLMRRGMKLSYRYSTLCGLLPVTRQKYLSDAKKLLDPAHEKLKATGFLAHYHWGETSPKTKGDWIVIYYPGRRAIEEIREAKTYFKLPEPKAEALPEYETELELEPEEEQDVKKERKKQTQEEMLSPITQELINRGITKAVAVDFAESFDEEYLAEKIEMHDYKKEIGEITTNAAGWLREAIAHDYRLSEEQLKKQAKLEKKKAQQEEQRTLEEKAREIQEQRLLEALKDFPEEEQWVRERVVEHVNVREMTIKTFGGEQFTEEEIAEMYLNYKAQVPKTDEEKRGWLISHDSKYALSSIISELREEQQKSLKESTSTANEPVLLNSIEDVLGEVARQRAEFEARRTPMESSDSFGANQKKSENEENEDLKIS